MAAPSQRPHLQSFGRRRGRRLRPGQQRLLGEALRRLSVATEPAASAIDPGTLFAAAPIAVWLEIGFGGGEHLAALAQAQPRIGFIGAEPYINGVATLLARIERDGLANIRLWPGDIRDLLPALAPGSIERVYILFPDPWPKARQKKRRLVTPALLADLARAMSVGGRLLLASDDADYVQAMREALAASPDFAPHPAADGFARERPADSPMTRYEAKTARQGRSAVWLSARRK